MNQPSPIADLPDLFPDCIPIADIPRLPIAAEPAPQRENPKAKIPPSPVPAKMAVYLLTDAQDAPLLLSTVGNLRAAIERRLAEVPPDQKSKRILYAQIARHLHYRVVYSPFVANLWYMRAAKLLFPDRCREFITLRPAHFIAVNPEDAFPRITRTQTPDDPAGKYVGPIAERRAADKLIETVEDLFDLCRYFEILRQAPNGKACAYKEMGKCPAPCDGSIPMETYRHQIAAAFDFLTHPQQWLDQAQSDMRRAAAKLEFEAAARIKQRLTRAEILRQPAYLHLDTLANLTYLTLQPGAGRNAIEPLLIHGGAVFHQPTLHKKTLAGSIPAILDAIHAIAATPITAPLSADDIDTISLLTHHLDKGADDAGLYLRVSAITDSATLLNAAIELLERRGSVKPLIEQSSDRESQPDAPGANEISPRDSVLPIDA